MLDHLSRGRVVSGFVRGIGWEYFGHSVNPTRSRERFEDKLSGYDCAFDLLGGEMAEKLGDREYGKRDPKCLTADAAFETVEEEDPIHRMRIQSRRSSLMLVLARVFSSTRLTMTAQ